MPQSGGLYPYRTTPAGWQNISPAPHGSTFYHLLPYVEQAALHRQFRGTSGWFGYAEHYGVAQPITTLPPVYMDPGDPSLSLGNNGWALMSYAVSVPGLGQSGCDWCPGYLRHANLTGGFPDGTANTLLVAERYARPGECFNAAWGAGNNAWDPIFSQWGVQNGFESRPSPAQASCYAPHAIHGGGLMVALADGSVRSVSPSVSSTTFGRLQVPDDGSALGNDW
jgi:prepilin-type processing-associated H-X9-DG protein